jgi:serine/threonine protein kinase
MSSELREQLQVELGSAYTLERELGGGGMSRVFVAEEVALGRKVVVKVVAPELVEGVSVERFTREVKLAARLRQANIIPVLTSGTTDGTPYYTMPFVDGLSLRADPRVLQREVLFDVSLFDTAGPHSNYDVSPDGRWFVFARRSGANHIVVLQNIHELARRTARGAGTPP